MIEKLQMIISMPAQHLPWSSLCNFVSRLLATSSSWRICNIYFPSFIIFYNSQWQFFIFHLALLLKAKLATDGSFSPGRGKWAKSVWIFLFLKLHCDQTVWFFKVFSTVLKRLCPLQSKNTFVCPSKNFWSPVQHPCFCPIERFLGKD